MTGHFSTSFRRFARNSEGATMIEFALVFPLALMITFGIMEISLYMVSTATLEGGLKEASRYGITQQTVTQSQAQLDAAPTPFKAGNDPRLEAIGLVLDQYTLNLIDLNNADVKLTIYDSFSAVKDGEPYTDLPDIPTVGTPPNGHYDPPGTPGTPLIPAGQPGAGTPGGEPYSDMNCDGSRTPAGPKGSGPGAPGNIVVYDINYNWKVLTPIVGKLLGKPDPNVAGGYIIPMRSTIVVKNEPILSGSTFCSKS
jgi:Flp pilus assembly pilin Flp